MKNPLLAAARLGAIVLLAALAVSTPVSAQEDAGRQAIVQAIEDWLPPYLTGLPGQAHYRIGEIRSARPICQRLEVTPPPGERRWGRLQLAVHCRDARPWTVHVAVDIEVSAPYLASARPLSAGQVLSEADVVLRTGDISRLPADVLSDAAQAIGNTLTVSLGSDRPLRASFLRITPVVQQGQTVRVIVQGRGFSVSDEGRALGNAGNGQTVQVRLSSGRVVSGVARADGLVELGPVR